MNFSYAAAMTCAMLVLYVVFTMNAGRMRDKTGVKAPAVVGHPDFERAYRVQMNTLEWMAVALPTLWIYALLGSAIWASAAGALWIVGRIIFALGYIKDPAKRRNGMMITMMAQIWLLGGAIWAIVISL